MVSYSEEGGGHEYTY